MRLKFTEKGNLNLKGEQRLAGGKEGEERILRVYLHKERPGVLRLAAMVVHRSGRIDRHDMDINEGDYYRARLIYLPTQFTPVTKKLLVRYWQSHVEPHLWAIVSEADAHYQAKEANDG